MHLSLCLIVFGLYGFALGTRASAGFTIVTAGKKKDNRVEVNTRAGETHYFRARALPRKIFARFETFSVIKEEAKQDAEKPHYLKPGDIKSPRVVKDDASYFRNVSVP